jgi:hypothetical protein
MTNFRKYHIVYSLLTAFKEKETEKTKKEEKQKCNWFSARERKAWEANKKICFSFDVRNVARLPTNIRSWFFWFFYWKNIYYWRAYWKMLKKLSKIILLWKIMLFGGTKQTKWNYWERKASSNFHWSVNNLLSLVINWFGHWTFCLIRSAWQ